MAESFKLSNADFVVGLHLTKPEAETLKSILNRIGGDPQLSSRKYADGISDQLSKYCIRPKTNASTIESKSSIIFNDGGL